MKVAMITVHLNYAKRLLKLLSMSDGIKLVN